MLRGNAGVPGGKINFTDIGKAVDAFKRIAYPEKGPTTCDGLPRCGDGNIDPGEDCDDAGESATCDANCTFTECGDDTLNVTASEECDGGFGCTNCLCDADFEPTAPPSLDCQPTCGNGSVDPGEECDGGLGCTDCLCDADFEPTAPPSLDCQPTCGNDSVDPGEECDGMDDTACPGACLSDCTCGPFCGNGVCDPGEDSCNCPDDCGTPDESETPGSTCSDGLDNDCDGDADCRDPDCDDEPDCEGVPTVSQWGMTVLLVALLAGIALKFRRSRTT
ncbi:MAG: hypothetical protein IIC02_01940 [Planctomycetes bacterium]|nr:hypothetical protein [Planctomycetota bacterium]